MQINKQSMNRCAIIGSKGYIGNHLKFLLEQKGIIPKCYDVYTDITDFNYKSIDLTDKKTLYSIDLDVDYIFLISGLTGTAIGFDEFEKFLYVNEFGILNILDLISKSPYRPKVIFPSTRLVYKGVDAPISEDDCKETKTIYAVNKLACEGYLKAYSNYFDIPFTVFRICVPYGNVLGKDYSFGTVGFFINQALNGNNITLFGDGTIKRTFTHISDVCSQMILASFNRCSTNEIYNIGGETYTLNQAANIIAKKCGVRTEYIPWPLKDLRIESGHTYFNDTKIQKLIGPYKYMKLIDFSHQILKY